MAMSHTLLRDGKVLTVEGTRYSLLRDGHILTDEGSNSKKK